MKNVIKLVHIALHFAGMSALELLNFARSIKQNIASDPDVTIDSATQTLLGTQIDNLQATVTARETDPSEPLTQTEYTQAGLLMLTLVGIAQTTETTANTVAAGNPAVAITIIERIGFQVAKTGGRGKQIFRVVKTSSKTAELETTKRKQGTIYYWSWSLNLQVWKHTLSTNVASVVMGNLPGGSTVYFREAFTLPSGRKPTVDANVSEPNWGDPIRTVIPS